MSKSFMFAVESSGDEKLDSFPAIQEQINSGRQILKEIQPDFLKYVSEDSYKTLLNEEYNEIYNLLKYGSNTVEVLAENVTSLNLEEGEQLFYLHDNGVQTDNLAWRFTEEEYSNADLNIPADGVTNHLGKNETDEELVAREINENQTKIDLVKTSFDALRNDEDEFWLMIEAGIGTAMDFSESVEFVKNWIEQHATWEDNPHVLETEYDHSFTFEEYLPELPATQKVGLQSPAVDITASTLEVNNLYALTDEIAVNYTIIRKADFDREVYFYVVDDINGTVDGFAPTDSGYVQAALNNIIFPRFSKSENNIETGSLQFDAGSLIVPLVINGGTLTEAQNGNAKVYFSYAGASGGDGLDHIKLIDGNVFGFNNLLNDADSDVNDIVIKLDNFSI